MEEMEALKENPVRITQHALDRSVRPLHICAFHRGGSAEENPWFRVLRFEQGNAQMAVGEPECVWDHHVANNQSSG